MATYFASVRVLFYILILSTIRASAFAQVPDIARWGYRHLTMRYQGDTVDLLMYSGKGEDQKQKPVFFFCQGSMPQPLVKIQQGALLTILPFEPDSLASQYHLVIVGKPGLPLVADVSRLEPDFSYYDSVTHRPPVAYSQRNLLSYYVPRNLAVIDYLQKQPWVSRKTLVVAGHSEGSHIAAKMAASSKKITHLIYAGGNPFGRILNMIGDNRKLDRDTMLYAEATFQYWQAAVDSPTNMNADDGDSYRTTYEFSKPEYDWLKELSIPVLVSFGTRDIVTPFLDYLRVDMMRRRKRNFTFQAYVGWEHNYFPVQPDGRADMSAYNWDKVGGDWARWLARTGGF